MGALWSHQTIRPGQHSRRREGACGGWLHASSSSSKSSSRTLHNGPGKLCSPAPFGACNALLASVRAPPPGLPSDPCSVVPTAQRHARQKDNNGDGWHEEKIPVLLSLRTEPWLAWTDIFLKSKRFQLVLMVSIGVFTWLVISVAAISNFFDGSFQYSPGYWLC